MSAFIVSDEVYQQVASKLRDMNQGHDGLYVSGSKLTEKKVDEFVRELRDINVTAVNYRYNENTKLGKLALPSADSISLVQLYKHLQAIRYQCMEHIDELPGHLRDLIAAIAGHTVESMPGYDEADWA